MRVWPAFALAAVATAIGAPHVFGKGLFDDGPGEREMEATRRQALAAEQALEAIDSMENLLLYQQMQNGDCAPAIEIDGKAKQGDAKSQWMLADLYRNGLCVPSNKAEMVRWLHAAADSGFAKAEFELAIAYLTGDGASKSPQAAASLLIKAFEGGVADAARRLAMMYEDGEGVPQDRSKAIEWFKRAADSGSVDASAQLALIHLDEGRGDLKLALQTALPAALQGHTLAQLVSSYCLSLKSAANQEDLIEAHKWANIASASSNQQLAEVAKQQRTELESRMKATSITEAQRRASEFRPQTKEDLTEQLPPIPLPEVPDTVADKLNAERAKAKLETLGVPLSKDAFYDAIRADNLGVFKLFHKAGADLETRFGIAGLTPLYLAVDFGAVDVFAYLVSSGADVNAPNRESGATPLLRAIAHERPQMIDRLLQREASARQDPRYLESAGDFFAGETPLSYAIMMSDVALARRLFDHGASVREKYVYGQSPLMRAAEKSPELVAELLARGADASAVDNFGESTLDHALKKQPFNSATIELLLQAGATPEASAGRLSSLMKATYAGDADAVRTILAGGADPNAESRTASEQIPLMFTERVRDIVTNGGTALLLAAELGHAAVAKTLLEYGADRGIKVQVGGQIVDATQLARQANNTLVLSILENIP